MRSWKKVTRIIVSLVCLLVFATLSGYVLAAEKIYDREKENNNSPDTANIIELGQPFRGVISDRNDSDCFSYKAEESKDITFLFIDNNNNPFTIFLIDKTDNNKIIKQINARGKVVYEFKEIFFANHEYVYRVSSSVSNANYEMSISGTRIEDSLTLKGSEEMEYNDTVRSQNILPREDILVSGKIKDSDDQDYFKFEAEETGHRNFIFYPQSNNEFFIFLCDITEGRYIFEGNISTPGKSQVIKYNAIKGHEYRFFVTATGNVNDINNEKYLFKCWKQ